MSTSSSTSQPFGEGEGRSPRKRYNARSCSTSQITEVQSLARETARKKDKIMSPENWSFQDFDVSVCIYCMKQGTQLTKVKAQGTKSNRTYFLDEQNSCIRWKPTRKGTKAKIAVDCIKEVREGQNTDSFKRSLVNENINSAYCFSIIYGNGLETVDLVANTKQEACIWIHGIRFLLAGLQMEDMLVKSNRLRDNWLRTTFETADKSKNGLLDMDEVIKLLHKLNFKLSKRKIKKLFKEADTNTIDQHEGQLDYEEFIQFYKLISTRKELLFLLQQYSQSKQFMTTEELQKFLMVEQKMESVTIATCEEIIDTFEPVPENIENKWLGIDGFTKYLLSPEGNAFNQNHKKVHQDMTRPLSHYYMAASHNTYLIGDQLMSQSSVDIYACVLQSGCRCVELDCWDGKDGEPVIYHGYTLTTKILFREVIETINKYAFVNNPYPVVLSIENHCSVDQQKKMAQYLGEILGDKLHSTPPSEEQTQLPSPEDLKEKILIKTKKLPIAVSSDADTGEVTDEDSADEMEENFKLEYSDQSKQLESIAMAQLALLQKKPISPGRKAWQVLASKVKGQIVAQKSNDDDDEQFDSNKSRSKGPQKTKKKKRSNRKFSSTDSGIGSEKSRDDPQEGESGEGRSRSGSKKKIVLSKMLSDLVVYTKSSSFSGFSSAPFWELPSMGEMRAMNLCSMHASKVARFTRSNLCRVYPSAYRIDSSNYNPIPMWNAGIQIVALNYQTEGKAMQQCKAKFSYNGGCGYVLKPDYLCNVETDFNPQGSLPNLQKKLITLQIISGQQLPKPPQSLLGERGEIIDPFVEVEVIGLACDTAKMVTKTIQDNGFSPIWNSTMQFGVQAIDLAMIRFAVWDEDPIGRDFIGQATLPVASLTQGYKHIHLDGLDQATIFVHISITDFDEMLINPEQYAEPKTKSIVHLKSLATKQYNRSKSAEDSRLHVQPTNRKPSLGKMFSSRRRHTISAIFNRPKPIGGAFESSQDDNVNSKDARDLEVMLINDDETVVSSSIILDQITTSNLATRLEEDGSVSIAIDQLQFLFDKMSVSTLLTCVREGTLNIRVNESSGGSICRLLYQYVPLQRPLDLTISETDENSIEAWWNNLLQDMSDQYRRNSIASTMMLSNDNDSTSSSSSESFGELSPLSDLSDTFIFSSNTTSSIGIDSLQREDPEGSSGSEWKYPEGSQSLELINKEQYGLSKSEDWLNTDQHVSHTSVLSIVNLANSDETMNSDMGSMMGDSDFEELYEFTKMYESLQNQAIYTCKYPVHSLKCAMNSVDECDYFCQMENKEDVMVDVKDGLSQQCDDAISCISVPCNIDGDFDTLDSKKGDKLEDRHSDGKFDGLDIKREEKPKVRKDFMSLECDDVISDISGSDYESDSSSTDSSVKLNSCSETSIPSVSFSEGAITGDLTFEGHYNLDSINSSNNSIPDYMMQRFVPKQRHSRTRRHYLKHLPEYNVGRSYSSTSSEILSDTNRTCIKLLTPPPVKLRRSLSDRIITSSKVPFSSSVSSTLCEELMITEEQESQKEKNPDNFINLNSNNSNNNDGSDESSSDKDGSSSNLSAESVSCAGTGNSTSSLKHSEVESNKVIMPMLSINVTKDDPLWQSSDDDQDSSDSSSSSCSEKTILDITLEEFGKKLEAIGAPSDDSIEIGELKIKDIFDPEEYNFYKKCFLNRLHQAQKKRIHDARRKGKKRSQNKIKRKELSKLIELDESDKSQSIDEDHRMSYNGNAKRSVDNSHLPKEKDENENRLVNDYGEKVNKEQSLEQGTINLQPDLKNEEQYLCHGDGNESTFKKLLIRHNRDTDYIQLHQMPDLLSNHSAEDSEPVYENNTSSTNTVIDETMILPEQAPSIPFQLDHLLHPPETSTDIDYGDYVTLRFNDRGQRLPLCSDLEVQTSVKETEQKRIIEVSENIYEELPDLKERKLQRAQSMMLTRVKAHHRPRPIDFNLEKMFLDSLNLEPGMMHDLSFEEPRIMNVNKTLSNSVMETKSIVSSSQPETFHSKCKFEDGSSVDDVCELRERSKQIIDVMTKVTLPTDKTPVRKEHNLLVKPDVSHVQSINETQDIRDVFFSDKNAGSRHPVIMAEKEWNQTADHLKGTTLLYSAQIKTTDPKHCKDVMQSKRHNEDSESAALLRVSDAQLHNRNLRFPSSNQLRRECRDRKQVVQQHVKTGDEQKNSLQSINNNQLVNSYQNPAGREYMQSNSLPFPKYQNKMPGYKDGNHFPHPMENAQYRYHCQRFNESEEALLEYKSLRSNVDYVAFPRNRQYFKEYSRTSYPHNYRRPPGADRGSDRIMVDQATSPGISKNVKYTNSNGQQEPNLLTLSNGSYHLLDESSKDSNSDVRLTSTPTRSCRRVLSEIRQWNLSAIESNNGCNKTVSSSIESSQQINQQNEKQDENTSLIYENMASLYPVESKQTNNQNSTITDHVDPLKNSLMLPASLTTSYDHTPSPSTLPMRDVPHQNYGIKRWYTNDNVAAHKVILKDNNASEVSLNNSTPNTCDKQPAIPTLTPCQEKQTPSVKLPCYKDHLEKQSAPKHYTSTPRLNEDDDSVFLNDSDYDEETPPRPHFFRSASQPDRLRSSMRQSSSVMKRTKSVRFEVPGEKNSDSPPSLFSEEISNANGEQFSIIERLVGKQSYKEILEKWAKRNKSNEEENYNNKDSPEKCLRRSPQGAIYASPNTSYNGYTQMVDGVEIKEYADIGIHEMGHSMELPPLVRPSSASSNVTTQVLPMSGHQNRIDMQSPNDIHALSRYQMNYRGMESSDFWKPIENDENLRHHSSSSSNMSIPSSTTDITYLTEFDRNDARRGVIKRDMIPPHYNRCVDYHPSETIAPPFDVVSPDDKFKWTNGEYHDDRAHTLPDTRKIQRYSAGDFNNKFSVPKKHPSPKSLQIHDIFKDTRNNQLENNFHHTKTDHAAAKQKDGLRISNLKNGLKNVFKKKGKKSDDDSSGQGSESSDNNQPSCRNNQHLLQTFKDQPVMRNKQCPTGPRPTSMYNLSTPLQCKYRKARDARTSSFSLKTEQNEPCLQPRHRSTSMPFVAAGRMEDTIYFSLNV